MNIFYLSKNTTECAQMHNDKHCVKMILEYSQLLSTAHRILDGVEYIDDSSGRNIKRWKLDFESYENVLYKATHINHPSAVWVRQTYENYRWLHALLRHLCREYTHRYGRIHKCESSGLVEKLSYTPFNIPIAGLFSEPPACMPEKYIIHNDAVWSYQNYYVFEKDHLAKWTKREVPEFYSKRKML